MIGMAKILFIVLVYNFSSLYAAPCDMKLNKLNLCVNVEYLNPPPGRKNSSDFKLTFTDLKSKNKKLLDQKLDVYLWMKMKNGHEHGSEKVKIAKKEDYYLISNVWFLMLGQWELHVKVLEEDEKVVDQSMMKVNIERQNKN